MRPIQFLFGLFFCLTIFLQSQVLAQSREYIQYTNNDGLQSNNYNFYQMQDSKGNLWCCSQSGICRFDGRNFTYFTTRGGLPDYVVLRTVEAADGHVWFLTMSGHLGWIEGDSIHIYPHNAALRKHLWRGACNFFQIDADGTIHMPKNKGGYYTADSAGNVTARITREQGYYGIGIIHSDKRPPMVFGMNQNNSDQLGSLYIFDENDSLLSEIPNVVPRSSFIGYPLGVARLPDNTYAVSAGFSIFRFSQEKLLQTYYEENLIINPVHTNRQGDLFASSLGYGVMVFPQGNLSVETMRKEISRPGYLNYAMEDQQGGLWVSEAGNGIHYSPYDEVISYDTTNSNLILNHQQELEEFEGNLYSTTLFGQLIRFDGSQFDTLDCKVLRPRKLRQAQSELYSDTLNGQLFVSFSNTLGRITRENPAEVELISGPDTLQPEGLILQILSDVSNDFTWVVSSKRVLKVKGNQFVAALPRVRDALRCIVQTPDGKTWIGGNLGLWMIEDGKWVHYPSDDVRLNSRISHLKIWKGNLLIFNPIHGLFTLEDGTIKPIKATDFPWEALREPIVYKGEIWSSIGNMFLRLKPTTPDSFQVEKRRISIKRNFRINDWAARDDHLFFSTSAGLYRIPLDSAFVVKPPPNTFLTRLRINEKDTVLLEDYALHHTQNYLRIRFNGVSLGAKKLWYQYRLIGVDEQWKTTEESEVQYTKLTPGSYRFEIRAKHDSNVWGPIASFEVSISPPFWATWWFLSLLVIAFLLLIGGAFQWRFRRANEKREVEQQLLRLESQALRAQINPHFIFNVLAAIQGFVSERDTKSSEIYLGKFARLIRLILENSRESYIPLSKELETLQHYLDMEQMRFKDRFIYQVVQSEDLDIDDFYLPPMLIQPYLENAIIHGISPSKTKGKITLRLVLEDHFLVCAIRDNGVGRAIDDKTATQPKEHQPLGMLITRERLRLLNTQIKNEPEVVINDLKASPNQETGTEVLIKLPLLKHSDLL